MPARSTRERGEREARRRARLFNARQSVHAKRVARRRRDDRIGIGAFVLVAVLATLAQIAYFGAGPGRPVAASTVKATASASPTASASASASAPPASLAENRAWTGSMTLNSTKLAFTLDGSKAPRATANFVSLVRRGFYRNVSCHRLTTGSLRVLQCGDPKGDGSGGPGYTFGPIENAPKNDLYKAGVLAMARQSGNGSSQGSQFFVVYGTSTIPSDAAGGYTVFGTVTKGLGALTTSVIGKGVTGGGSDGKPKVPTRITAVSVH